MKRPARWAAGDIALWCAFWLIGLPLAVIWNVSGLCTVVGCGIQEPSFGGFLLALFTLSSIAMPFASVAIWRSASRYPRRTWGRTLLAFGAKLWAAVWGSLAVIGLLVILYMVFIFIYAAFDRV